jgi:hypothetical protein
MTQILLEEYIFINFKQADSTNQESSFIIVSTNKETLLLTLQLAQNGEHGVLPLAFLTAHSQAYNVVPNALWKILGAAQADRRFRTQSTTPMLL